ncbi:spinster family MFS transporter [Nitrospirillum viridazoti]|uniref:MFS family arabinose efflux permease n=2 Tax=Nitrospirillum TaxID=1543705 RepID=A0A560HVL3_9PROT|nr:MFS transporter [Nitrospirillum amazonense]TWB50657.1 putative MFS family arabinose efflux permease [Nitrospirillum amazonense]
MHSLPDPAPDTPATVAPPPSPAVPLVSAPYRRYALTLLFVTYALNYLDRQIVTILAEPIKRDLGISDTQLGLLTGLAFGLVYCGFGLPIARLADRFNRVWIIGASLATWSVCTVLCGRAASFGTLVAARMGVGIGEAGCAPVGMALISDYTPKEKRASALAFFAMGTPVGSLLGLALGGVIADAHGWRTAFLVTGLPGIALAVVAWLTLKEPRATMVREVEARAGIAAVFTYLWTKRTFWLMTFGAGGKAFIGYGQAPFVAAFFLRVHGGEIAQIGGHFGLKSVGVVGIGLGVLAGVFGALSNWLGGWVADRYAARDLRAYGVVPAVAALVPIPFFIAAMLVPSFVVSLMLLVPGYLLGGLWFGPVLSSIQGLVPRDMRATAGSVALFILNMIGIGFGSLVVGKLSDGFNTGWGNAAWALGPAEGVRWALVVSATLALIPALLFWRSRATIRDEMVS